MTAYYNENDPFAAAWLRELIKAGAIAPGDVDERSILDVSPIDLMAYTQCHFFAGIGVWSYALRNAGWDDNRPVWTGSCPCQPFSTAGAGAGFTDERHLWPAFHYLIQECGPGVVFGEQVASKDGRTWLDHVQTDMENLGFAIGAGDICAAGFGAPHIRQRLYFVAERLADTECQQRERRGAGKTVSTPGSKQRVERLCDANGGMGNAVDEGLEGYTRHGDGSNEPGRLEADADRSVTETGGNSGLADTCNNGCDQGGQCKSPTGNDGLIRNSRATQRESTTGPTNGFWRDPDWLFCRDGKWRAVRPGTFPLVNGAINRVGRLRGYGNAINAEAAKAFIESYLETKLIQEMLWIPKHE